MRKLSVVLLAVPLLAVGCGSSGTTSSSPSSAPTSQTTSGHAASFDGVCVDLIKELKATLQHDYFGAPPRFAGQELERTALDSARAVGASRDLVNRLHLPAAASRVRGLQSGQREFEALARQIRRSHGKGRLMSARNLSLYEAGQRAVLRACTPLGT